MTHLTAIILTHNEARHIRDCIESLRFADRVIVFDSFSTDETAAIAREYGTDVIQHPFDNFAAQRNAALGAVADTTDWVLFVDADERISEALAAEIRAKLEVTDIVGWRLPRHNYIFGVLTLGAGWYPDYQTRLLRCGFAKFDETRKVHEVVQLDGAAGSMENPITHYNYRDLPHFLEKQERYLEYEVEMLLEQGVKSKPHHLVLQPLRHFYWRFFTLKGSSDRWHGLKLSALMAWYEYRKFRLLASRQRER